jgi:lipopolysaccharide transport system ATP-binding protein
MSPRIRVSAASRRFVITEQGAGGASLLAALRSGAPRPTEREIVALDAVSLEIADGERVGVIGRNGAGKTTLLSLLAGVTEPTSGVVDVSGHVHAMLTIGAVMRDEATGRENIMLDGAFHGRSQAEIAAIAEDIIAFAELGEFIDRPVRTYSSGMKARLAFSMGAFIDPDILILDETLSVGDAFFSRKATQRMREIAARGRIVVLVSHSLGAIVEMCDRCIWLDKGRVVMDGEPRLVTRAYEKALNDADEAELAVKFERGEPIARRHDSGRLDHVATLQQGRELGGSARAFVPLDVTITGALTRADAPDIVLEIQRVDGRRVMRRPLSAFGAALPRSGAFRCTARLDPLILGAGLYRFAFTLQDRAGAIDRVARVLDIVDEEGQFGGQPLIYLPPLITARRIGDLT